MKKTQIWLAALIVVLASFVAVLYFIKQHKPAPQKTQVTERAAVSKERIKKLKEEAAKTRTKRAEKRKSAQTGETPDEDDDTELIDAATADLDKALEGENNKAVVVEALKLIAHNHPEVRKQAAFALGWAGLEGLEGLTAMLTDPNKEVREEVLGYWKDSLSEITSAARKQELIDGALAECGGKEADAETFEELVNTAQMELEGEALLQQLGAFLDQVDDSSALKMETIRDAINFETGEESTKRSDLKKDLEKAAQEARAEAAELDADAE